MTIFYLDTVYKNSWMFKFLLLVNLTNIYTIKKISNRNKVLNCSKTFLNYLCLSLFAAKSINAENVYIRRVYARDTCIWDIFISNSFVQCTYFKSFYIRSVYSRATENTCVGDACTKVAYFARNAFIKSAAISVIYFWAYKLSKSFVKSLKLLLESISKMLISFYLHLQVI